MPKKQPKILNQLDNEFGGKWSIGKYDNCILLKVENSDRIDRSADSIQNYIAIINQITINWETKICLYFEHSITTGNFNISTTKSKTYIVRPE